MPASAGGEGGAAASAAQLKQKLRAKQEAGQRAAEKEEGKRLEEEGGIREKTIGSGGWLAGCAGGRMAGWGEDGQVAPSRRPAAVSRRCSPDRHTSDPVLERVHSCVHPHCCLHLPPLASTTAGLAGALAFLKDRGDLEAPVEWAGRHNDRKKVAIQVRGGALGVGCGRGGGRAEAGLRVPGRRRRGWRRGRAAACSKLKLTLKPLPCLPAPPAGAGRRVHWRAARGPAGAGRGGEEGRCVHWYRLTVWAWVFGY